MFSLLTLVSGCTRNRQDGAPWFARNVQSIPNAVPKIEPLSRYGNPPHYQVRGKRYQVLTSAQGFQETGLASWYGTKFHGRRTSSGEPYDLYAMTAAHKSLPLPTYIKVKNLSNQREVIVKVNDRGPFIGERILDLSFAAAKKLDLYTTGTAKVQITALNPKSWQGPSAPVVNSQPLAQFTPIYLQLGAFSVQANAEQFAKRATEALPEVNHLVKISQARPGVPSTLYHVRLGPVDSKSLADKLIAQCHKANLGQPKIVNHVELDPSFTKEPLA